MHLAEGEHEEEGEIGEQGDDDVVEIPVMVAADSRPALARRLWLVGPEEPDPLIEAAVGYLVETMGNLGGRMNVPPPDREDVTVVPVGVMAKALGWRLAPGF